MPHLAACLMALPAALAAGDLRMGFGEADITPPLGTPMAGYYHERPTEGVADPLKAKVMVLDDGTTRVALVQLDLISTTRQLVVEARREIEARHGLPGGSVLISATHSHTGPVLADNSARHDALASTNRLALAYSATLPGLIAAATGKAIEALRPVEVKVGVGHEDAVAFNRRFFMRDGSVGWNPGKLNPAILRPTGPIDPHLHLLLFEAPGGGHPPLAAHLNYTIHLDTVGGNLVSADMPGAVAELLKRVYGDPFFTLYHTGACGNINHLNTASARPQRGPGEAFRIGTILAAEALKTVEFGLKPLPPQSKLATRSIMVPLPLAPITPDDVAEAQAVMKRQTDPDAKRPAFMELVRAFQVLDVAARDGKPWPVEVQVVTLGHEVAWVALPGEIFVELGLAIKRASPFPHTMVAELANGSIGYIPNREAYPQGNYEVVSARCAAVSGELLVDAALGLLREMFGKPTSLDTR